MQSKDGGLLKPIRIRIMSEAYDLADRDDSEGYNSVKVMCSDVLAMIKVAIAAEREACAKMLQEEIDELRQALAQPQKEWVGLTADELNMIVDKMQTWNNYTLTDVYHGIEAKLKEKNG